MISEKGIDLVFLIGCQRSGTTWLQMLLSNHHDIGTSQESHIFNHFLGPAMRTWDKLLDPNIMERRVGLPAYLTETEFYELMKSLFFSILSNSEEFKTSKVFLEKTPDHAFYIDKINILFPKSKFILLVRNPEDVVESMLDASKSWGKYWAPRTTLKASMRWRSYMKFSLHYLKKIDESRKIIIKYEALKEDTKSEIKKILKFLNLNDDDDVIHLMMNSNLILKKYGEFARRDGKLVQEPRGFNRIKKGKLNFFQLLLVSIICKKYKNKFNYGL